MARYKNTIGLSLGNCSNRCQVKSQTILAAPDYVSLQATAPQVACKSPRHYLHNPLQFVNRNPDNVIEYSNFVFIKPDGFSRDKLLRHQQDIACPK